jgi:hypothetical protein
VLKVLDYKTGTYKALKIIRNKKRFHAQVRSLSGRRAAARREHTPAAQHAPKQLAPSTLHACTCTHRATGPGGAQGAAAPAPP